MEKRTVDSCTPLAVASVHILEELRTLEDSYDQEKALLTNYILVLRNPTGNIPMDTIVLLADRAVECAGMADNPEYADMVDGLRFSAFEAVDALLNVSYIDHLDTVLAADDETFYRMVQTACAELRDFFCRCDEEFTRGKSFNQMVQEAATKTQAHGKPEGQRGACEPATPPVEPFVVHGIRAQSCYAELDTTLEREKALALNYALAQVREAKRSHTDKELLIDLVQRAVDFKYMADDDRFTELDIVRALLQDNCIEHLPTVLSAEDEQFLMMAIAACEEMRAACEEGTCLHSEHSFLELVAAQGKAVEERKNFLSEDAVRKLPVGTAVTLVCEKGEKYRCMVLAPLYDEQLHLVKPDPKDNSAPLCFGMLYQGYGTGWNILI